LSRGSISVFGQPRQQDLFSIESSELSVTNLVGM